MAVVFHCIHVKNEQRMRMRVSVQQMSRPLEDLVPPPQSFCRPMAVAVHAATLRDNLETEVLVIGGGYTGLSSALHLAEQGKEVILLESREFGWGASGRAFGQVVPYAKHDSSHILKTYGARQGQAIIDLLAGGPDLVFGLIDRYAIDCDDFRSGMIVAAHSAAAAKVLRGRADYWSSRGAAVEFLESRAAAEVIGSDYYSACLLERRAGSLNPLAYARGLAEAALQTGAAAFEQSPVNALRLKGNRWHAKTPQGSVKARTLVLATNAYSETPFGEIWPDLRRSFVPIRTYQLISAPLRENLHRSILPRRQSMIDTRHLFSGIRVLKDGRLHISADGPAFDPSGKPRYEEARERVCATFPQIDSLEWDEGWSGWIAVTKDQYPRLHQLEPDVWCAFGYSGRGIAFGTLMGREIARHILRHVDALPRFPCTPVKAMFGRAIAPVVIRLLMAHYRRSDARKMAGYVNQPSRSRGLVHPKP